MLNQKTVRDLGWQEPFIQRIILNPWNFKVF